MIVCRYRLNYNHWDVRFSLFDVMWTICCFSLRSFARAGRDDSYGLIPCIPYNSRFTSLCYVDIFHKNRPGESQFLLARAVAMLTLMLTANSELSSKMKEEKNLRRHVSEQGEAPGVCAAGAPFSRVFRRRSRERRSSASDHQTESEF